jgi:cytochrome c oxidase subunit 2
MLYRILYQFYYCWQYPTVDNLYIRKYFLYLSKLLHSASLEIFWTIIPTLILILIAIPSFSLLYSMDEIRDPEVTIKVIGHQWYWSYEYFYGATFSLDSYMLHESELKKGALRLLFVDNPLILPINTEIRLLITSSDVLHSWAVPSFGIKIDAVPGRLNQVSLFIKREGRFYGQCSELCGVNHAFMPISVWAVQRDVYIKYLDVLLLLDAFVLVQKYERPLRELNQLLHAAVRDWLKSQSLEKKIENQDKI